MATGESKNNSCFRARGAEAPHSIVRLAPAHRRLWDALTARLLARSLASPLAVSRPGSLALLARRLVREVFPK